MTQLTLRKNILFAGLLTLAMLPRAPAHAMDQDMAVWGALFLNVGLSERWGVYVEGQNRVQAQEYANRGNRFLLRWAARFTLAPGLTVMAGHAWTPNFSPYRNENRLWQQLAYTLQPGWWLLSTRLRMEERWIQNADDVALRLRLFFRAQYHFAENKVFAWAFWNELFANLNNVNGGPKLGFDQNRAFMGPSLGVGPRARFEVGYLNVFIESHSGTTPDLLDHTLATFMTVDF